MRRGVSDHEANHASNQEPAHIAALPFVPLQFLDGHREYGLPIGPYVGDRFDQDLSRGLLQIPTVFHPIVTLHR
jgi:hypothetical protein